MPQAEHTVTIQRPRDVVFAFLADGEKAQAWRAGVLDVARLSGDGVGIRYRQGVRGPMGRRVAADYEVTAYEPGRRLVFATVAGPVRPTGRFVLDEVDGGTRVTFSLAAQVGGIRRLFMGGMVQRTMDAEVRALERLERVLESG